MKIEIWKDIEGYEGLYQVSTEGRVRSLNNNGILQTKILKQGTQKGYKHIALSKDYKSKTYLVHRLVAQAFIPNPNNWPQVNHKNEIRDDNRVENLEWCTQEYNNNYGNHIENVNRSAFNRRKAILMFSLDGVFIQRFNNAEEANKFLGINKKYSSPISDCCRGKIETYYGYKWKYEEDCK